MSKKTTIYRITKLGLTNFWRNGWLSVIATLIMSLTLITIAVFIFFSLATSYLANKLNEKIDIRVFFTEVATDNQIEDFQKFLSVQEEVGKVEYTSKKQALADWRTLANVPERLRGLITEDNNPLPRSIQIKLSAPQNSALLERLDSKINQQRWQPLIRNISYEKDLIKRLTGLTTFIRKAGYLISGFFILIAIMVVINTIRLAILVRREEVEIMRLVGASELFVKTPFVIEGTLYGLIATFVALILLKTTVLLLSPITQNYLHDFNINLNDIFSVYLPSLTALLTTVGVGVGVGASMISVRKHL